MNPKPDYLRKRYGPMREKSLKNAISYRIARDFPRVGGERIRQFCAEAILEVVYQHLRPREHVRHGQVVWLAISLNDPPAQSARRPKKDELFANRVTRPIPRATRKHASVSSRRKG